MSSRGAVPTRDPGAAAAEIVWACRRLDARGLVAGSDGNLSVRLAADRVLVTPSGVMKGGIAPDALVEVDMDGRVLRGDGAPSSELDMHLRIYRERADVGAVVHAHPPTATGFAVAGEDLMAPVLPEIILQTGPVPLVPYATPGTSAVGEGLIPYLRAHDAFLLANHGATTVGSTLTVALQRMESLEHGARILLAARLLGRVTILTDTQRRELAARAPSAPHREESDT